MQADWHVLPGFTTAASIWTADELVTAHCTVGPQSIGGLLWDGGGAGIKLLGKLSALSPHATWQTAWQTERQAVLFVVVYY